VFINCPFDRDYEPILQAILFCIVYLRFTPRIATESHDSGETRLQKIQRLICDSKYSIHDLSRCEANKKGEYFRLNMPFELGIDYGCRQYFGKDRSSKKFLILEEKPYRYQQVLSDIAGCDIKAHDGSFENAIRQVRNWLVSETRMSAKGAQFIVDKYADFQEWYYEKRIALGFSERDIQDYPTSELLDSMVAWVDLGEPISP
jgi:hypothetical protein